MRTYDPYLRHHCLVYQVFGKLSFQSSDMHVLCFKHPSYSVHALSAYNQVSLHVIFTQQMSVDRFWTRVHILCTVVTVPFSTLYSALSGTLQIFTGIYRVFIGKSKCGDFKFLGIACYILAIPVILKSPRSDFHCNNKLWGNHVSNNIMFGNIPVKFAGISCKF